MYSSRCVVAVVALLAHVHDAVRPNAADNATGETVEVKVHDRSSEDPPGEKEFKALSKAIQAAKQPLAEATKQGLKTIEDGKTWAATKARADDHIDTLRKTVIKAQEYYRDENQKFEQRNTQAVQDVLAEHASTIEGYDNTAYEDVDDGEAEPEVLPRAADTTPEPASLLSEDTRDYEPSKGLAFPPAAGNAEVKVEIKSTSEVENKKVKAIKKATGSTFKKAPEDKSLASKVWDFFR